MELEILEYIKNPELISPTFFSIWQFLRVIFLIVSAIFVIILIYVISASDYLDLRFKENFSEFHTAKPDLKVKVGEEWDRIVEQAKDEKEAERKLAVIEADDMANKVLSRIGYDGETLMDKLDGLNEEIIPNIEEIKSVHKKRRDIVYDPNKSLSREETKEIILIYEKLFKDLQVFGK